MTNKKTYPALLLLLGFSLCSVPYMWAQKCKVVIEDIDGIREKDSVYVVTKNIMELAVSSTRTNFAKYEVFERKPDSSLRTDDAATPLLSGRIKIRPGAKLIHSIDVSKLEPRKHYLIGVTYETKDGPRGRSKKFYKP
jgi:hypothetical protein